MSGCITTDILPPIASELGGGDITKNIALKNLYDKKFFRNKTLILFE